MIQSQCASCNHIVKANVHHCPMCNGCMKLLQEEKQKECPRCSIPLHLHHYRNYELDQCNQCDGIYQ